MPAANRRGSSMLRGTRQTLRVKHTVTKGQTLASGLGIFVVVVLGVAVGMLIVDRLDTRSPTAAPATAKAPDAPVRGGLELDLETAAIDGDTMQRLVGTLAPANRKAVLESADNFTAIATREAERRSVLAAAAANGLDEDPTIELLMQRAAEQVLADAYLTQVVRGNLDPEFPRPEQVEAYYAENADRFSIPGRVHLWQIFLSVPADAGEDAVAAVRDEAAELAAAGRAGEEAFRRLALEHSEHAKSRLNQGYMGLVRWDQMLDGVRSAVESMSAGEVSGPIRTDAGFHVVRRGSAVEPYTPPLEEVRPLVTNAMLEEARAAVRQAALAKIVETYPVSVDENLTETWRLEMLMSALESSSDL